MGGKSGKDGNMGGKSGKDGNMGGKNGKGDGRRQRRDAKAGAAGRQGWGMRCG